jgi:prophage antirepressor-like protein
MSMKARRFSITVNGEYGHTECWFLTEHGLYEVLMQSRKPIAVGFKKGIKQLIYDARTGTGVMQPAALAGGDLKFSIMRMLRHHFVAGQRR